jgi:putative salt-induced outer membrane protein
MARPNKGLKTLTAGAIWLCAVSAQAEWKGQGELGVVLARGNTETDTINAKFDMTAEVDPWKHSFGFSALQSSSASVTTGDRYELHEQSNYNLSATSYVLGSLRYDDDKFSPFIYQAVASVGFGYKFYDSEATKLATEVGLGYRRAEDRVTAETKAGAIVRGGLNYEHKLSANSDIYDKFLVESGSDNTFLQNEAGIKANIISSLALSVAYTVRYNTDARAPTKNTDQLITANLAFSF